MKLSIVFLIATASIFLIQCSQGDGRVRGKYCPMNHIAVKTKKEKTPTLKVGKEFIIENGVYNYQSSRVYINDLERNIRVDISHVKNDKTGKYENKVNCVGGTGVDKDMKPFVVEALIPSKIVVKDSESAVYDISYKKVTFDIRQRGRNQKPLVSTFEDQEDSTVSSKISDLYRPGTNNGRNKNYAKTETSMYGSKESFEYIAHTSLKDQEKSSENDPDKLRVQLSVSFTEKKDKETSTP